MKHITFPLMCILLVTSVSAKENSNYISFRKLKDTHQHFAYKNDGSILISGHRGGMEKGFPENSIEGLQNVLDQIPAFFEIDPRLTKDSVIVLMHDETLDRTTNAKRKLSDIIESDIPVEVWQAWQNQSKVTRTLE